MPILLVNLTGVPDDEADEIRNLLEAHDIPFYETSAGRWGISQPGLWLSGDARLKEAKALLTTYQHQRLEASRKAPPGESFTTRLRQNPLKMMAILVAVGALLYFLIAPFITLGQP